ncbi:MAG: MFS transporter [Anaerolineae bacterium]|nr:MFS transporter [Anaerolineae bacterium]
MSDWSDADDGRSLISHLTRPSSAPRADYRRALFHEVAMSLGMTLADPATVIPVLLRELRASNTIIGLLPSIRFGGWLLPQLFAAGYLQSKQRKVPYVVGLDVARSLSYVLIALLVIYHQHIPSGLAIGVFLAVFGFTRMTAGSATVGRFDVVGKVVPRNRLAEFYATRGIWTGAGGLAAGVFIGVVLASGLRFPVNYATLFIASAVVFTTGALVFGLVREGGGSVSLRARSPLANLGNALTVVRRDPLYRRYLTYRLSLEVMGVAAPFYMVYAADVWGVPVAMAGTYVAAGTAASLLANLHWRRRAQHAGNVTVLTESVLLGALAPLLPLLLTWFHGGQPAPGGSWVPALVFLLAFVVQGAGNSGREICNNAVLINMAPDSDRPSYIGLTNTITGLLTFTPILAGRLIDEYGYQPLLLFAVLAALVTWWAAARVREPLAAEAICREAGDDG